MGAQYGNTRDMGPVTCDEEDASPPNNAPPALGFQRKLLGLVELVAEDTKEPGEVEECGVIPLA